MRDLERYRAKRDPGRTPEPMGDERQPAARRPAAPRAFVVQQHAARRLHWDLRLEIDDVLVSWAVPRGPSLDPDERRLAVRTEDHPLEYADFEGVIPAGNYGAGAMIVWDRGIYTPAGDTSPAQGLAAGKLDLWLEGHKLRGCFALVRTGGESGRDWLLLRKGAPPAEDEEIVEAWPGSVLSGLSVEELAEGTLRDAELAERARSLGALERSVDATSARPMLASSAEAPFSAERWIFELKYDGVRLLVEKRGEDVRLFARSGAERTGVYPELVRAVRRLPVSELLLDGEVVALDASGRPSFERLQRRFTQSDPAEIERLRREVPVLLYAFDLLEVAGFDLRQLPLLARKELLARVVPRRGFVTFADHVEGEGAALFEASRALGLEGVVAKRANSRYETGRRSKSWRKLKVPRSAPLVIVGWLAGRGSRTALGSLMLAWWEDERLVYAGNVGSGLAEADVAALLPRLEALRVAAPACEAAPELRGAAFVQPCLVCDVRYTEVTSAGLLRHPVFERLREDLAPQECTSRARREPIATPATREAPVETGDLALTRLDKVFWPIEGYTKRDLLDYYEAVWPWLEPYLRDRPVVLTRYPDGIEGKHFYQKNAPEFTPDWVQRREIDGTDYFLCNDLRTLLYVVNSGAIPLHVWSARVGSLERPDWLVMDLDPKQAPFAHVVRVARHLHRLLDELRAEHFVKTSGQDGLHVLLPLGAKLDHADARALGEVLARVVCAELPEIATLTRPVAARGDKVYVDHLQNGRGKLIAGPLSVRPRPGAPVSMPLTWRQVSARLDPARFTILTAPKLLARTGDPFLGVLGDAVDVGRLLDGLGERLRPLG